MNHGIRFPAVPYIFPIEDLTEYPVRSYQDSLVVKASGPLFSGGIAKT